WEVVAGQRQQGDAGQGALIRLGAGQQAQDAAGVEVTIRHPQHGRHRGDAQEAVGGHEGYSAVQPHSRKNISMRYRPIPSASNSNRTTNTASPLIDSAATKTTSKTPYTACTTRFKYRCRGPRADDEVSAPGEVFRGGGGDSGCSSRASGCSMAASSERNPSSVITAPYRGWEKPATRFGIPSPGPKPLSGGRDFLLPHRPEPLLV